MGVGADAASEPTVAVEAMRPPVAARVAVSIAFASNGLLFGAWAPRIPEVKHDLGISSASLGLALLAPAVGSILTMRLSGWACARYGSAAVTRVATVGCLALGVLPGLAMNLPMLWLALLGWGLGIGAMDVAMNAQGVTVEAAYRRPVLSGFHASWSLGTFVGAVAGGAGAATHLPISGQQAIIGAVLLVVGLVADRALIPDPGPDRASPVPDNRRDGSPEPSIGNGDPDRRRRWPRLPSRRLALLGVATVCSMVAEGAVADWSGVLLRDHLHVGSDRVGFGFAAFSIAMTTGRVFGDRAVHRFGRRRAFGTLSVVGGLGVATGLSIDTLWWVVAGFALLGIGLSIMVPVLFSSAADGGGPSGPAIATVASFGYTGFLIGPSAIGLIAESAGVRSALGLLPLFTLAAGIIGLTVIRPAAYERRTRQ